MIINTFYKIIIKFIIFLIITGVRIYPQNNDLQNAYIYFREERFLNLQKIIEKNDFNEKERLLFQGMIYAFNKKYEEAENYFNKIIQNTTEKNNSVYIMAKYLLENMYIDKGLKRFIEELENNYYKYLLSGDCDKAFYIMEKLIKLDPANAKYRLEFSKASLLIDFPYLAIKHSSMAIQLKPNDNLITFDSIAILGQALTLYYLENYNLFYQEIYKIEQSIGFIGLTPIGLLEDSIEKLSKISNDPNIPEEIKRKANEVIHSARVQIQRIKTMRTIFRTR